MAEEKADYLETHKKLQKGADVAFDTFQLHHRNAYNKAVEEHLMDKDGAVHYEWLDKGKGDGDDKVSASKLKKKFTKEMRDFYVKKVENKLDTKVKDDFTRNAIAKAWYGVDMGLLDEHIGKHGSKFKWELYQQATLPYFIREMKPQVYRPTTDHITEEDIPDLTKKLGLEGRLTSGLSLKQGRELLQAWSAGGEQLSEDALRETVGEIVQPKKEKKKKK